MRPGNPWLVGINVAENEPPPALMVSVWSRHDSMVAPQASANLACARNVVLTGIGHNALLSNRAVMDEVAHAVANEIATPQSEADSISPVSPR